MVWPVVSRCSCGSISVLLRRYSGLVTIGKAVDRLGVRVGELDPRAILRRLHWRLGQLELGPGDGAAKAHHEVVDGDRDADLLVGAEHGGGDHLGADGGQIDHGGGVAIEVQLDAGPDAKPGGAAGALAVEGVWVIPAP